MKTGTLRLTLLLAAAGTVALAQTPPPMPEPQGAPPPAQPTPPPGMPQAQPAIRYYGQAAATRVPGEGRPPQGPPMVMEHGLLPGPHGKWWDDPDMAQRIGLNSDQQKKMDDIFQQHRLRLIDLNATVQKEETIMEPLVAADQPDEAKIVAQIDKVAQARAELEKANARMLMAIRRVLTPEQFQKLRSPARPGIGHVKKQ
jgi:Spy/CpxP family protein refolding chaperone